MTSTAREAFEEALAMEQSGKLDKAVVFYLRAQELSPRDTAIAYKTASALFKAGYLEEAQSQLRRLVFIEPDNLNARASLANCQLLLGDTENAAQNFRDVFAKAPDNRNALYGYAIVCLRQDKPHEAADLAKQLVALLPDSPAVLSLFAETQAKTGQSAPAIAAFRKALKSDPEHFPALMGLAAVLLRRKRFDEVIELTIKANGISPTEALPLEILSDALSAKGSLSDAFEAAEAAHKLNPASATCLVRLSVLGRKRGDLVSALRYALSAHDADQKAAAPLNALGASLAALKYSDEARSVLTGLNSGRGLEPRARKIAEDVIAAERASDEAFDLKIDGSAAAGEITGLEGTSEAALVSPASPSPGTERTDDYGVHTTQSQSDVATLTENDPVPNVLGLQRRDRT